MSAERQMPLAVALLPIMAMTGALLVGALAAALSGEVILLAMLFAAACASIVAVRYGHSWHDVQSAAGAQVARVLPALLILLGIGMLIASWMLSGTIPYLVSWGIRLINPSHLAITAFVASAIMSSFTGTSWGSAGTIGVAMMGTAAALDVSLPMVAGAVISGAYFGDKMSPLSDTTIIASVAAEVDVYAHIRGMLPTAVPSFAIAALAYTVSGAGGPRVATGGASGAVAAAPEAATALLSELAQAFSLHWILLLPPLVIITAMLRRVPSLIAIALSSLTAVTIAFVQQNATVPDVAAAIVTGVRVADASAHSEMFVRLVERGGLYSMAPTLVIVFAAFLLAGAMEVSGALDVLLSRLLRAVRTTFALVAATMAAGLTLVALTSHAGVTLLVVGGLFRDAYQSAVVPARILSRSLEDSVSITEVLLPWTVSAVFMATTLGVPTLQYAPWAVFCWTGPLLSLILALRSRRVVSRLRESEINSDAIVRQVTQKHRHQGHHNAV